MYITAQNTAVLGTSCTVQQATTSTVSTDSPVQLSADSGDVVVVDKALLVEVDGGHQDEGDAEE